MSAVILYVLLALITLLVVGPVYLLSADKEGVRRRFGEFAVLYGLMACVLAVDHALASALGARGGGKWLVHGAAFAFVIASWAGVRKVILSIARRRSVPGRAAAESDKAK